MTAELGFALRPGVFSAQEIRETANILDKDSRVSRIFIPEGRTGYESLEIVSSILGLTQRLSAGSGVIRLLEHDPSLLTRRVQTLQGFSSNRAFLGVGTGSPGPQPGRTVSAMLQRIDELRKAFQGFPPGVQAPEIFVATLKSGIAKRVLGQTDGLLLNFCSPRHAHSLIESLGSRSIKRVEFSCYLKLFFSSQSDQAATRLMLQEFLNYDTAPQYHEMFVQDGTADAIRNLKENDEWRNGPVESPKELLKVSLANPTDEELDHYVQSFQSAGVTLPVVYPYFTTDEKSRFKLKIVDRLKKL